MVCKLIKEKTPLGEKKIPKTCLMLPKDSSTPFTTDNAKTKQHFK